MRRKRCFCCGGFGCEHCSTGTASESIVVAISGVVSYFVSCVACNSHWNASHTLTHGTGSGAGCIGGFGVGGVAGLAVCDSWGIDLGTLDDYTNPGVPPITPPSCVSSAGFWTCTGISAAVGKAASNYYLTVQAELCWNSAEPCSTGSPDFGQYALWQEDLGTTKPDCSSWTAKSVSYSNQLTENPAGFRQSCDFSSATCTVTAL